jgi:hypothetical protein
MSKCTVKSYWGKKGKGWKKKLFPFQGGVGFLEVNSPFLFEGGGGGGLGFIYSLFVTFVIYKFFVTF